MLVPNWSVCPPNAAPLTRFISAMISTFLLARCFAFFGDFDFDLRAAFLADACSDVTLLSISLFIDFS